MVSSYWKQKLWPLACGVLSAALLGTGLIIIQQYNKETQRICKVAPQQKQNADDSFGGMATFESVAFENCESTLLVDDQRPLGRMLKQVWRDLILLWRTKTGIVIVVAIVSLLYCFTIWVVIQMKLADNEKKMFETKQRTAELSKRLSAKQALLSAKAQNEADSIVENQNVSDLQLEPILSAGIRRTLTSRNKSQL